MFPIKKRKVDEISPSHPVLVSQPSPSAGTGGEDYATKATRKTGASFDEDITTLDMYELVSSPSYKSTPTRFSRSSRIQPTPLHGFGDISLIQSRNEVILDALES